MSIVTIRGTLGSGASEIGKQVAERLHIDYIDREIIAQVAEVLNKPKQDVIAKEMPQNRLWERIARAFGQGLATAESYPLEPGFILQYSGAYLPAWQIPLDDTRYLSGLESVVTELAKNQSCVICGRGSQFILKNHPGALHVMIVASMNTRLARVMQAARIDKAAAEKEIAHSDGSRHEFIKRYFRAEMEDSLHYDIVINTDHVSMENAASLIISALPFKKTP